MSITQPWISNDFQRCIDFHGHLCPGLTLGYIAAVAAMKILKEERSEDEEIVTIVETDACCADAIQVITGCTFGKGNFFFKDYGKTAFTFISRGSGKGIRIAKKHGTPSFFDDDQKSLMEKVQKGTATEKESQAFKEHHQEVSQRLLDTPLKDIFSVFPIYIDLPERARIEPSEVCDECLEPTMVSKLMSNKGRKLCPACERCR